MTYKINNYCNSNNIKLSCIVVFDLQIIPMKSFMDLESCFVGTVQYLSTVQHLSSVSTVLYSISVLSVLLVQYLSTVHL